MWLSLIILAAFYPTAATQITSDGISRSLSSLGRKLLRPGKHWEKTQEIAGFTYTAPAVSMRSALIACVVHMRRNEIDEALDSLIMLSITLGFEVTNGYIIPIAKKFLRRSILKNKAEFKKTLSALREYKQIVNTDLLDPDTDVVVTAQLKRRLGIAQNKVSAAFGNDMSRLSRNLKNSQIYADLVTSLNGIKSILKVRSWVTVMAGPFFDAVVTAFSIYDLYQAVKNNDPLGIASSSLGMAAGVVGIAGFAAGALATAGTTVAAVAGPVGAIVGMILSFASLLISLIGCADCGSDFAEYEKDLVLSLKQKSVDQLDDNLRKLESLNPGQNVLSHSYVFQLHQGLATTEIRGIPGRDHPVKFDLSKEQPTEKDGYWVMGAARKYDRNRLRAHYEKTDAVDMGYEWYGRKIPQENNGGVTLFYETNFLEKEGGFEIKTTNIKTFSNEMEEYDDTIVFGELRRIDTQNPISSVMTGGGDDIIMFTGLLAQPWDMALRRRGISRDLIADTGNAIHENNVVSFQCMSTKVTYEFEVNGVEFDFRRSSFAFLYGDRTQRYYSTITGIKTFIGSPYQEDEVRFMTSTSTAIIREFKGKNSYYLGLNPYGWGPFAITIDDISETPGTLEIAECFNEECRKTIEIRQTDLFYANESGTLFIYGKRGRNRQGRWEVRGTINFNNRLGGHHVWFGGYKWFDREVTQLPATFKAPIKTERSNENVIRYHFNTNIWMTTCEAAAVYLDPPEYQESYNWIKFIGRKLTRDSLVLTRSFINRCVERGKVNVFLQSKRMRFHDQHDWYLVLTSDELGPRRDCPVRTIELLVRYFAYLKAQLDDRTTMLIFDFCCLSRDRGPINVADEILRQKKRQEFKMIGTIPSPGTTSDIPSVVVLGYPSWAEMGPLIFQGKINVPKATIIIPGGLANRLYLRGRKIVLKRVNNYWTMQIIIRMTNRVTHSITLVDPERIELEGTDGSYRWPLVTAFHPTGFFRPRGHLMWWLDLTAKIREEIARGPRYEHYTSIFNDFVFDCGGLPSAQIKINTG